MIFSQIVLSISQVYVQALQIFFFSFFDMQHYIIWERVTGQKD